ncbi:dihydrofolate reductase [bacterium]|nr:dihydrofolate reductase [bacterium]
MNRINYVLTTNTILKSNDKNLIIVNDFKDILDLKNKTNKDIYIIGGKQIYELFFNYADELIISKLDNDYQCDILLNYNLNDFKLINEIKQNTFKVEIYQRIRQYGNN